MERITKLSLNFDLLISFSKIEELNFLTKYLHSGIQGILLIMSYFTGNIDFSILAFLQTTSYKKAIKSCYNPKRAAKLSKNRFLPGILEKKNLKKENI